MQSILINLLISQWLKQYDKSVVLTYTDTNTYMKKLEENEYLKIVIKNLYLPGHTVLTVVFSLINIYLVTYLSDISHTLCLRSQQSAESSIASTIRKLMN